MRFSGNTFSFRLAAAIAFVALLTGLSVAFFLWALDLATRLRWDWPWLMAFLPIAGILITVLYAKAGPEARGNGALLEAIGRSPGNAPPSPFLAPLVLFATLLTHLTGGSAGREGTAVQMGGGIAEAVRKLLRCEPRHVPLLVRCGMAAGFGAVFGTPLAGAVFALEAPTHATRGASSLRRAWEMLTLRSALLLAPCVVSAILGDSIVHWLGLPHTSYAIRSFPEIDFLFLAKAAVAAVTFGLAGRLFIGAGHLFGAAMGRFRPLSRPVVGAALVLGISALLGTTDYLGLGVHGQTPESTSIVAAFSPGGVDPFSWFWKLLLTTLTLASGFKGGEVTPLFFVGSTLGNALAEPLGLPVDLLAALGFIALFAAASGTPLASTLMAGEIFGFQWAPLFLAVNLLARVATGPRTIYDEA